VTITSILQDHQLRERRLQFMRTHQNVFDVEPTFPIKIFEEVVLEIEYPCGIEASCKVEGNRLFAGRFAARGELVHTWPKSLVQALKFLDRIETRIGVEINRDLLQRFLAIHIESKKIVGNTVGIDLHPKLEDSSVKIHIHINREENPEELVRTALTLDGGHYSAELTEILLKSVTLIGFDFFLDGRSYIELYATTPGGKHELRGNWGRCLRPYIRKNFSKKIVSIFEASDLLNVGFSKANVEPVLYFGFKKIKDIPNYFSFNDLGNRIYSFCQNQDANAFTWVGVTERETENNRLNDFRLYYTQLDTSRHSIKIL